MRWIETANVSSTLAACSSKARPGGRMPSHSGTFRCHISLCPLWRLPKVPLFHPCKEGKGESG